MRPVLLALLASAAASLDPASTANGGREIDRVVAVVRSGAGEQRVITRSRLEEETRIAIIARGGILAATEPLDDAALAAGLEALLDETLLGDDAARLQVFDGDPVGGDLLAGFRARFGSARDYQAFLRRWDISEDDLGVILRRKARIQRYLDSRASNAAQVSEGEVSDWLEHAAPTGARDRELARTRLMQERAQAEVKDFIRALRARAEIRILSRTE